MSVAPALMSSAKMNWRTPECVLERVRKLDFIGLDPCADDDPGSHFAAENCTKAMDGLSKRWAWIQAGLVFVNPPYGRVIGSWVDRCFEEYMDGIEVIALVPARTDTRWFQTCWKTASAICFWKGRLTFEGAPAPAPFPSAVVYWGEQVRRFGLAFEDAGRVVTL